MAAVGVDPFRVGAGGVGSPDGGRIEAGHFGAIASQVHVGRLQPGAPSERLTIPIKVTGTGKPGHVLVNLAVDVEIVVDDDDKTV